mmetsp:Transcript_42893/g.113069  ORF Transcript_42893/g.113069 Transcript_42893/m.113069 type:complete len:100 (-) Transcript_42893:12-311(-)
MFTPDGRSVSVMQWNADESGIRYVQVAGSGATLTGGVVGAGVVGTGVGAGVGAGGVPPPPQPLTEIPTKTDDAKIANSFISLWAVKHKPSTKNVNLEPT